MSLTLTVIYIGDQGDAVAHAPGCKDIARVVRRTGSGTQDFTLETQIELTERLSAAVVGSLEDALGEVGSYDGLWRAEPAPCCRRAFYALPTGSPRVALDVERGQWVAQEEGAR